MMGKSRAKAITGQRSNQGISHTFEIRRRYKSADDYSFIVKLAQRLLLAMRTIALQDDDDVPAFLEQSAYALEKEINPDGCGLDDPMRAWCGEFDGRFAAMDGMNQLLKANRAILRHFARENGWLSPKRTSCGCQSAYPQR